MSVESTADDAAEALWRPKYNPWLIAVVVALAAFMEVLDGSIANVALPYMAGSMAASNDESTWVLTSYLVSNAIVLPMSGWLAVTFGRKRFFMGCLAIFTLSSLLCGVAPSLATLLLFRVVQGAGGGGLQPMAQAIGQRQARLDIDLDIASVDPQAHAHSLPPAALDIGGVA